MKRLPWHAWTMQYVLPAVILLGSLAIMFLFSNDPDMVWIFVIAPILTFLTAFVVRPERSWVAPLAVTLLIATAIVVAALLDRVEPRDSLMSMYWWTGLFVGLPLTLFTWLGRGVGMVFREWREDRRWQTEWRNDHPSSAGGTHTSAR
jgi:hypothetical protein